MELWLDTINLELIKEAAKNGVLTGITTNPHILSQADTLPETKLKQILSITDISYVAAQVVASDYEGMIEQARYLASLDPARMIVKIPVNPSGLKAIYALSKEGIMTMATAIFDQYQIYLSALACAKYAAIYLSKIPENIFETLQEMNEISKKNQMPINLLAASIKDKRQLIECALLGLKAITITDDIYKSLTETHFLTENSQVNFAKSWSNGVHSRASANLKPT